MAESARTLVGGTAGRTRIVPHHTAERLSRAFTHLALIFLSFCFAIPFLWLVTTAFKPDNEMFVWPPVWIPNPWIVSHFQHGWTLLPFTTFLKNTLLICIFVVIGTIASSSVVAYSVSRIRWIGRRILFAVVLSTLMVPYQVTMVPLFVIFKDLHWINTFLPLIVPAFFGNAFFIFLLRQFFMTIPVDITDAAKMDGANEYQVFSSICLPLARPALATVGLFAFMGAWNDFLGPLIYLRDESKYTLSIGLAMLNGQYGSYWGAIFAMATLMTVPIIVLFFFTQRTFIQGITLTGVKG
ncbi:MAG: carbohydrate ABC transporter permease [Chloroflexi bacterium]|nr:carbohydrate ABC transporter permease [Chloroflexota bacterium]